VRKRHGTVLASVAVTLAAVGATLFFAPPAWAHGAMMIPGSRTFLCYEDAITSTGQIVPHNPACQAAIAQSGPTPLYNWFAVGNRSGAASGETVGFIPDGKLCSGNSNYYDFSGFDQASPDWPKTHLTSGATIQIRYNKWAAHPGTWYLYITKDGWDPTTPLTWADLESTPFSTVTDPPSVGDPGSIDSYYYWNATLPANKTGYHIIYSVWARSDSTETFYGCSDVVFDGGNGQVTGIGATAPPPTTTPCSATYAITNTWPGGFQAQVTVSNPTTSTLYGWTVSWVTADDETITSSWNGTLSQAGSLATMTNAAWNNVLAPNGSLTFGLTANETSSPIVPASISCQSP
jgi:predicted carbohydrate-binding protein with CBM5 and CBM33 domain